MNPQIPFRVFFPLCLLLGMFSLSAQTVFLENPPPKEGFTEEKPSFLYFKDATLSRKSKYSFEVDITLAGEIPSNMEEKFRYYMGFDIDNDKSTGGTSTTSPNFGQDIGFFIRKIKGTNRFDSTSNTLVFRGKKHDINITALKVRGDKISFNMRSELFGYNDAFKFFIKSSRVQYDGELVTNDIEVDQLPRKGYGTFHAEAK